MKRLAQIIGILFTFAAITAHPAAAVNYLATVKVHPGVGSDTGAAWMNCGWHTSCVSPYSGDGTGADWTANNGTCCNTGTHVYFRSFNYMSISGSIGDAYILNYPNATCSEAWVRVRDTGTGIEGTVIYQHTARSNASAVYAMSASPGGTSSGNPYVSSMVSSEKVNCPWEGVHVHEKHLNNYASFTKNVGAPPGAVRHQYDCTPRPCKYLYQDPGSVSSVWERSIAYNVAFGCPC